MITSQIKILIIEDDAITSNIFKDILETEGFETIIALNGLIGIQQARTHSPDLIICDIIMPEVDGYGVLDALRQDPVTAIIPFIFLTGSDTQTAIRRGMNLGADDYLIKPSTVEELLKTIAARLQKQTALRHWYAKKFQQALEPLTELEIPEVAPAKSIFPPTPQLKEVFDFIEAHYHEGITLCDVAEAVGYSPAYLTNRVARQTGETVNSWIVKRRMAAARFLLQTNNQTIEQIATSLGYQNACHFSRQFRQHHGLPPHAWRKEHQPVDTQMLLSAT
ncbi:MAG: response regulator [Nostocaceae cyanobacterium]|nr:response regulator [Nostocaceae cyanobacterium]